MSCCSSLSVPPWGSAVSLLSCVSYKAVVMFTQRDSITWSNGSIDFWFPNLVCELFVSDILNSVFSLRVRSLHFLKSVSFPWFGMHHHKVFPIWRLTPRTDGTESDWILSSIVSWRTGCLAVGQTLRLTRVSISRSPDDAVMLSRLKIHVLTQAGSLH